MNRKTSVGEATGSETITIGERFAGPPGCGNGGYTCGTIAAHLGSSGEAAVVVRLQAPVPLGRALDVVRHSDGEIEVTTGEDVLARARSARLDVKVPEVPSDAAYGTEAAFLPTAHSMMLDDGWQAVADRILTWLDRLGPMTRALTFCTGAAAFRCAACRSL